jgi:hypothetical protein
MRIGMKEALFASSGWNDLIAFGFEPFPQCIRYVRFFHDQNLHCVTSHVYKTTLGSPFPEVFLKLSLLSIKELFRSSSGAYWLLSSYSGVVDVISPMKKHPMLLVRIAIY